MRKLRYGVRGRVDVSSRYDVVDSCGFKMMACGAAWSNINVTWRQQREATRTQRLRIDHWSRRSQISVKQPCYLSVFKQASYHVQSPVKSPVRFMVVGRFRQLSRVCRNAKWKTVVHALYVPVNNVNNAGFLYALRGCTAFLVFDMRGESRQAPSHCCDDLSSPASPVEHQSAWCRQ